MDAIASIARIAIFLLNGFLSGEIAMLAETTDITAISDESIKSAEADDSRLTAGAATDAEPGTRRECATRNETREFANAVARAFRKATEVVQ